MPIDFHNEKNRFMYSKRSANSTWIKKITEICSVKEKRALDIGCGGGIYTKALAEMGASHVTGLDFSKQMLVSARDNCRNYKNIDFKFGNALDTKLSSSRYDLVLERAVIHHITVLPSCFKEIFRVLKPGGSCIIQDRTPEDCFLEGSPSHIRGYFFAKYPDLKDYEISRRYSSEDVQQTLRSSGFQEIQEYKLWETRAVYNGIDDLVNDLISRTGRSVLHELSDSQLKELVDEIIQQIGEDAPIIEQDRWTIWKALKK